MDLKRTFELKRRISMSKSCNYRGALPASNPAELPISGMRNVQTRKELGKNLSPHSKVSQCEQLVQNMVLKRSSLRDEITDESFAQYDVVETSSTQVCEQTDAENPKSIHPLQRTFDCWTSREGNLSKYKQDSKDHVKPGKGKVDGLVDGKSSTSGFAMFANDCGISSSDNGKVKKFKFVATSSRHSSIDMQGVLASDKTQKKTFHGKEFMISRQQRKLCM
jgi:hypothetical protein